MVLFSFSPSVGFVNDKFPGIHEHHHQHSAGENVVGGNFALVVRVPHKSEAGLTGGAVGDGARGRGGPGLATQVGGATCWTVRLRTGIASGRAHGRVRAEIWAASKPGAVGK